LSYEFDGDRRERVTYWLATLHAIYKRPLFSDSVSVHDCLMASETHFPNECWWYSRQWRRQERAQGGQPPRQHIIGV